MTIPYSIFLIAYAVLAGIFLIGMMMSLWSVLRFASMSKIAMISTFIFIIAVLGILALTWQNVHAFDWRQTFTFQVPSLRS